MQMRRLRTSQRDSAVLLQRAARAKCSRQRLQKRIRDALLHGAAVAIQCWFRQLSAQLQLRALRRRAAAIRIQSAVRRRLAVQLVAHCRQWLMAQRAATARQQGIVREGRMAGALSIQRVFRGSLGRARARNMGITRAMLRSANAAADRVTALANQREDCAAAVHLQAACRGWLARRADRQRLAARRVDRAATVALALRRGVSAIIVQACYRGVRGRRVATAIHLHASAVERLSKGRHTAVIRCLSVFFRTLMRLYFETWSWSGSIRLAAGLTGAPDKGTETLGCPMLNVPTPPFSCGIAPILCPPPPPGAPPLVDQTLGVDAQQSLAALHIQSGVRVYLAKRRVWSVRLRIQRHLVHTRAAVRIQVWWSRRPHHKDRALNLPAVRTLDQIFQTWDTIVTARDSMAIGDHNARRFQRLVGRYLALLVAAGYKAARCDGVRTRACTKIQVWLRRFRRHQPWLQVTGPEAFVGFQQPHQATRCLDGRDPAQLPLNIACSTISMHIEPADDPAIYHFLSEVVLARSTAETVAAIRLYSLLKRWTAGARLRSRQTRKARLLIQRQQAASVIQRYIRGRKWNLH